MKRLGLLALFLAGCIPSSSPTEGPLNNYLVEGGVLSGSQLTTYNSVLNFPEAPQVLSVDGETVWAGFPYRLSKYQNGILVDSVPLGGVPKFIQSQPNLVIGMDQSVYSPVLGNASIIANDAVLLGREVFWIDSEKFYRNKTVIANQAFDFLAANEKLVYAFGKTVLRWPDLIDIPMPKKPIRAVVMDDLYILTESGIYWLTPEGLYLGMLEGTFSDLKTDRIKLYTLRAGNLVTISKSLEIL